MLDWFNNKVGDLVSGKVLKVSEFGLLINTVGVRGVGTSSIMGCQEVEEVEKGDTVAKVVIYVEPMAKVCRLVAMPSLKE